MAAVASNGTLLRGINTVSATRTGLETYRVTFNASVDVLSGYYLVTPGLTGTCTAAISAEDYAGNSVFELFYNGKDEVRLDCAFSLVVCGD